MILFLNSGLSVHFYCFEGRRTAMSLSLAEYADSLDSRELIWPKVPSAQPVKAVPSVKPIPGVRAVLWDIYGCLLRTPEGKMSLFPDPELRLQIALDKTIHEFNMWNSMYRKPGPPWQSMINQYRDYVERLAMSAPKLRGDYTDVNLVLVWGQIINRLFEKEYSYETATYGDVAELAEKVAYFFHNNLQATEAQPGSVRAITDLNAMGIPQGILADGQSFTTVQLIRALLSQGLTAPIHDIFPPDRTLLSYQMGIRKPSKSLIQYSLQQFSKVGLQPDEILHVSCRLKTDLVAAKRAGMRTALLAVEKTGLEAPSNLIKDPQSRPDRLLTDITQITSIVQPT